MSKFVFSRPFQLREKRILELEQAARNASFHKAMEQHLAEEARKEQEQLRQRQLLQASVTLEYRILNLHPV